MTFRWTLIITLALGCASAFAQSSAFTYQGRLQDDGAAADGLHDLRFRLFDASTNGNQVGATLCVDNIAVGDGLFNVQLDFGQQYAAPTPRFLEIEARRDAGLDCAGAAGFTLLAPRQPLTATPLASHAKSAFALDAADGSPVSAVFVDDAGNVGVGTTAPAARLDVVGEVRLGGVAPHSFSIFNSATDVFNVGVAGGAGHYSASAVTNDIVLRNVVPGKAIHLQNGLGAAALTISGDNNVGIGAVPGAERLLVSGTDIGVQGRSSGVGGIGVWGFATAATGVSVGVRGSCVAPFGYGVFSAGDLGASGTKSFRIDHPDDPENKYLLHYCAESPEVINFYRGTATLDGAGTAEVELPHYFAKINKSPSYQLTAVGAPMPMLHVAKEIDEAALSAGARAEPGDAAPRCFFRIAGGARGAKVSWEVKAVRNDRWVQQRRAPVEMDKQDLERGTYQHPELYGQPSEKGMHYDVARPGVLPPIETPRGQITGS